MFAYCNNAPVSFKDNTGTIPQAVEDAMVHNRVLKHICAQNSALRRWKTCIYYNGTDFKGGWGFCDLYNADTGEVWELKKQSDSPSCTTPAARAQLDRYLSGKLKNSPDKKLYKPYCTIIEGGHFSFTKDGYVYDVTYWNEGEGILRYKYDKSKTEGRKVAEAFATILAVGLVFGCFPGSLVARLPAAVG